VWAHVAHSLPTVEFPRLDHAGAAARAVLEWEAALVHGSMLRRSPERYGREVRERLEEILSRDPNTLEQEHAAALVDMLELREQVEEALKQCDAVILPVTQCLAPLLSDRAPRRQLTRYTRPFNLTGHPVIALPGPSPGLPVGLQLIGRLGQETGLAAIALALERDWNRTRIAA
jgi:amidase